MIRIIHDFQPRGFRKLKGYGRTDHFDPKHTGKWDSCRTVKYTSPLLNGWLLAAGVLLLIVAMGWYSWNTKQLYLAPMVPLLFGYWLVLRSSDWHFSESGRLFGNIFILYAWKQILFVLMAMTGGTFRRELSGGIVWFGMAIAALLIVAGMFDLKREMQSGFVCAVDTIAMGGLWFVSLRPKQNLTLLYLTFGAMAAAAVINLIFTFVSALIANKEERANIGRYLLQMLIGCVPLVLTYVLVPVLGNTLTSLLFYVLLAVIAMAAMWPGSVPRLCRRALLMPLALVMFYTYAFVFWNAVSASESLQGTMRFIQRFVEGPLPIPAIVNEAAGAINTAVHALPLVLLKAVNAVIALPSWLLSEDGSSEVLHQFALNQIGVYLLAALLVSLGIEAMVRLRVKGKPKKA